MRTCERCARVFASEDSDYCYFCNVYVRLEKKLNRTIRDLDTLSAENEKHLELLKEQRKDIQGLKAHIRNLEKGVRFGKKRKVRIKG